jgi:hypothetical protein
MQISGTGITTFTAKVKQDFDVRTTLAIKWFQVSSGAWHYTDRGAAVDEYETTVEIQGLRGTIENFIAQVQANRIAGSNEISLSNFASNEHVFGEDINYAVAIAATVLNTPVMSQNMLKSFSCSIQLRAIGPTFQTGATFPTLRYVDVGYEGKIQTYTLDKIDTYEGAYTYLDRRSDVGVFEGTIELTQTELRNLRRWVATNRGTTYSLPGIAGVVYPFGVVRGSTYPVNVKVLSLSDERMVGVSRCKVKIKLGEVL